MPLVQTRGAASAQGFGEFAQATAANYIEEMFSCFLYTGTGAALTITNGVDLSTKGGLVWCKERGTTSDHVLTDSTSSSSYLRSNGTNVLVAGGDITGFTSSGFTLANNTGDVDVNNSTNVSWTFRKQPKFFDVVTYTGTGSNTTIAHALGSAPGCMLVKCTSHGVGWNVYHRSLTSAAYQLELNTTSAEFSDPTIWNSTAPTSSVFSVGTNLGINGSGRTYVAYLFAHDAGGFGLTGTDNVISCGSYTGNGSATGPVVTLGYEPQWLMIKKSSSTGNWQMLDNMRGMPVGSADATLQANLSNAESSVEYVSPTATGFQITSSNTEVNTSAATYIYIAIRRGPMKVPTLGTSVFSPVSTSGNVASITAGFPVDLALGKEVNNTLSYGNYAIDRLRGGGALSETNTTGAEYTSQTFKFDSNTQFLQSSGGLFYGPSIYWLMRRAPSFFDEVCYTGDGVAGRTIEHNLGVVPELMIVKCRTDTDLWPVYSATLGPTKYITLNTGVVTTTSGSWNNTAPTALVFSVGPNSYVNFSSSRTYVAYLFATCAGVSKVGSYSGNTGVTVTVPCGFTGGVRFVLITRTDSTGNWYVWDSARGIIAGDDPYLRLNSTAAEVTNTDYIDTYSAGFEVTTTAPAALNATGGTYIFLAIA